MKEKYRRLCLFILTVIIILTCVGLSVYFAGVNHEDEHLKNMLITIFIVLFFQFVIVDPLKFIVLAIDMATWPRDFPDFGKHRVKEDDGNHNRLNFLKQRLKSLKFQSKITERHRNERLNEQYKLITQDLFNYGKFMLLIFLILLFSRNELLFHNTIMVSKLFKENHTHYMGIEAVYDLNQLFDFVEMSLITTFNHESFISGPNTWIHNDATKMVGVVRMRQLRLVDDKIGWGEPKYSSQSYMPGWTLPHRRLHYTDRYWRTYEPWLPIDDRLDWLDKLLMNFRHPGKFHSYPELKGYITLLGRSRENSMKILDYLEQNMWLTYNTSAVFLDFTLYNVDANMFSVVSIRVERTPFGSVMSHVECDSVSLIEELEKKPFKELIVMAIYVMMVLMLIQTFVMHVWHDPSKMFNIWYQVDLIIIILNLVVMVLYTMRSYLTNVMLRRLEGANKLEFLDFRRPTRLHNLMMDVCGLLICLTTLRVWKLMQFSTVFQTFTKTLNAAWSALAATSLVIFIILMAFGIAFTAINGNNSIHFLRLFKTIISCLLFAFGFRTEIEPEEVFHGGKYLGMVMYAAMGFIVSIFLINVFVTIINDYFLETRKTRTEMEKRQINYFDFLMVEYYGFFSWINHLFAKGYKRRNRTVAENVKWKLDQRDRKNKSIKRKHHNVFGTTDKPKTAKTEEILQAEYRERIEHVLSVKRIMETQFKILELLLFPEELEDLPGKKHKKV